MGRWALAAMRKQKGERARAALSARKDCCCCMVCSKQWEKRAIAAARHTWAAQAERLRRGGKKKKKSPYILWQAEMMLLRLFITVSTSRIVEALKRKSKRKRFGLCLRCCCCFWCSLIHNKIAAAMARACSPRMYFVWSEWEGRLFCCSHVQFVITYAFEWFLIIIIKKRLV